ncbi:MAG: glycogen synthase [Actinomycetota bacterium]|nr:glycogen synthase [Actinomycetota bacterium]
MTVSRPLKVLFAIAEAYPLAKVGGLGDVGAALPKALAQRGHDVRLVLPRYASMQLGQLRTSIRVPLGRRHGEEMDVRSLGRLGDVHVLVIDRRGAPYRLYGYADDDVAPFVAFSKAVATFAAEDDWRPDIIHVHDWHCALVPAYARVGRQGEVLAGTGTVLTIHNLAHQGRLGARDRALLGMAVPGHGSVLASGIACADAVTTVSRGYLSEILTPDHGLGMDGLLRARRHVVGAILNGIDYDEFAPEADPHIPATYGKDCLERKRLNKLVLQRKSGLTDDPGRPLAGMVARLSAQKGIDLLCSSLAGLVALGAQVVVVGCGDDRYRRDLERAAARHPGTVAFHPTGDEATARLVYAGSDLFLSPSAYEPFGLAPLVALRYGAIPVVRRTGGLADTIPDHREDPGTGLGFTFARRCPQELVASLAAALTVYRDRKAWSALQRRAMATDFSWSGPARDYEELYVRTLAGRSYRAPALAAALVGASDSGGRCA